MEQTNDIKEKLWDGSFRVTKLSRYDGESYELATPIEYFPKCTRLATNVNSKNWRETADKWAILINGIVFDYYTGVGHRVKGKPKGPELSGVLNNLVMDSEAASISFKDWCDNYGYDDDSMTAMAIYRECQDTSDKLRMAKICQTESLREFLQDF